MVSETAAVALDYFRAAILRVRGAELAPKVRVAAGVRVTRPPSLCAESRVAIEPNVVFKLVGANARVQLRKHVFVGRRTLFDLCGELKIGEGTLLAPDCFITDHNHGMAPGVPMWLQPTLCEPVCIGSDCWLGAKVIVLPGVMVGDGAVVAAGAVVTRDVEPGSIVAGVPARYLKMR